MSRVGAEKLWRAILDYGNCREEWGAVGNSGEFYEDERDELEQLNASLERLRLTFKEATGWLPVGTTNKKTCEVEWSLGK